MMNTNKIIETVHDAVIDKVAEKCKLDGTKQYAMDVAGDLVAYAEEIRKAFADDGKIDDEEKARIKAVFAERLEKRVPDVDGIKVSLVWDGLSILWFKPWAGLRYYVNKWFDLGV